MKSSGQDHHHFRRKNKFEMIQKQQYNEIDIQKTDQNYIGNLLGSLAYLFKIRQFLEFICKEKRELSQKHKFRMVAIRMKLERSLSRKVNHLKEEKSQARSKKNQKKQLLKLKVSQKLKNYIYNMSDKHEEGLKKSKTLKKNQLLGNFVYQNEIDILIQKQRAKQVSEIANRYKNLEEKINHVKDDFKQIDLSFDF
ncbi:unnamed protein product [Paramecium sonneborni]|uniref:Uncharacterized protein n=1 Tax=Paramecium sonneborni TaxID=65129 RepID=A0A8S1RGX7_9CILI|nr:unnamed protein product [Paramecium sonneborni]